MIYYASAILAAQSGETADSYINTFAVTAAGNLTEGDANDWTDCIKAYYDTLVEDVYALKGRSTAGHVVKFLQATNQVPNYPLFETNFALSSGTGALELPVEVSLCVSYINDTFTNVPRARRRGRIYISGWASSRNVAGRPQTGVPVAMAQAYRDYAEAVNDITNLTAGVWSRTGSDVFPINRVWCDDEWDTMRSRGTKSTMRSEVSVGV